MPAWSWCWWTPVWWIRYDADPQTLLVSQTVWMRFRAIMQSLLVYIIYSFRSFGFSVSLSFWWDELCLPWYHRNGWLGDGNRLPTPTKSSLLFVTTLQIFFLSIFVSFVCSFFFFFPAFFLCFCLFCFVFSIFRFLIRLFLLVCFFVSFFFVCELWKYRWMDLYLREEGGGGQPEFPEKPPDNQSENRYHMLQMKIHLGSNPHFLKLVISSLGGNATALTHWTTGCRE